MRKLLFIAWCAALICFVPQAFAQTDASGYPTRGVPALPDRPLTYTAPHIPYESQPLHQGWQPEYLLSGPAAVVKGVGAAVWCVGNMTNELYANADSFGEVFTATLLWPFAVVTDSVLSVVAYAGVGLAHTLTFGLLVSDPPKQIEDMPASIYCVLSDNIAVR